uniref:Receptor ligand binding region domain-containing protein n=1 Tax=Varanus komodoensis TaxID=61221 RepID=A0A8D2IX10_VARKO
GFLLPPLPFSLFYYGSFDPVLSDKAQFPSLFWMAPQENSQYVGIVPLLKLFGWNWIGVLIPDNESGEIYLRTLSAVLLQSDICISLAQSFPILKSYIFHKSLQKQFNSLAAGLWSSQLNVTLVYGDGQSMDGLRMILQSYEFYQMHPMERVWIVTGQWDATAVDHSNKLPAKSLNGTLSFTPHTNVVPGFWDFLETISPYQDNIYFIHQFWRAVFRCSFPAYKLNVLNKGNCTGTEKLRNLSGTVFEMAMSGQSYNIYNAIYAVAHALHALCSSRATQKVLGNGHLHRSEILIINLHRSKPTF